MVGRFFYGYTILAEGKLAKKKKKASKTSKAQPVRDSSVSVNLRRARNGYVVSSYNDRLGKDVTYIAKTKQEALEYMGKMVKTK